MFSFLLMQIFFTNGCMLGIGIYSGLSVFSTIYYRTAVSGSTYTNFYFRGVIFRAVSTGFSAKYLGLYSLCELIQSILL